MSVIQKIRDKGGWIMITFIALALIAFVLQDRGLGGRGGGVFGNTTTMGKVNGVVIDKTDFENKLAFTEKMYGQQAGSREQLIGGVWNQEVDKIITGQEYDKLGLTVTGKELTDVLFDPQTSPLKREFSDPQTGEFKVGDAKNAFAQIKKSKNAEQVEMINQAYIEPTIQQTLRTKYSALLQAAAYVPKWLVEKTQADNNAVAAISFVSVPYSSIVDSTIKITEDDILSYAKKHHKEFDKDEETRSISYIAFASTPSGTDSAATLTQINALKADFSATVDAKAYIGKVGSEMAYYDGYFSKTRIQQANKDTIVKLNVNQVFGPYLDANNYVLAKMISIKTQPDSVKVRHILIATSDPRSGQQIKPDSIAKKTIDSIELAIKGGANFDTLCLKYSDDGTKDKGGVYDYFPQGKMVGAFNDFSFDKPVGSKGVVKTEYGYHYIEVLGQKNPQPAYKVAYLAKPIISSNETVTTASTAAAQFAATSKNKKSFDENALKLNKLPMPSGDIKPVDFAVQSVGTGGDSRKLVRWVYDNSTGDISEPFEMGDKYIVAVITSVSKPGLPSVGTLRPLVENLVRNEKKAKQIIDTKFKGTTLEAIATSAATTVQKADSVLFSNPFIPGVGMEPKVAGAAFNKDLKGKVSEAIAGSGGVYAVRVESIGAKAGASDVNSIKQTLMQSQKMAAYRSGDALKKSASIKDNRSKFY
ncbi:MAG: peptidylprolyl isomerase [Pedobacter sp.]|nr:peptidylprolyl isomerase [Chitinophagaceae bacterium]